MSHWKIIFYCKTYTFLVYRLNHWPIWICLKRHRQLQSSFSTISSENESPRNDSLTHLDDFKSVFLCYFRCFPLPTPSSDIVDIKPANMEELTEVITAAECHPHQCNVFVYSSSKGTIRLCDTRAAALCDRHCKCEYFKSFFSCLFFSSIPLFSIRPRVWSLSVTITNSSHV